MHYLNLRSKELIRVIKIPNKNKGPFCELLLTIFTILSLHVSCIFPSVLCGTQVYFTAIPAIYWLCYLIQFSVFSWFLYGMAINIRTLTSLISSRPTALLTLKIQIEHRHFSMSISKGSLVKFFQIDHTSVL